MIRVLKPSESLRPAVVTVKNETTRVACSIGYKCLTNRLSFLEGENPRFLVARLYKANKERFISEVIPKFRC